MNDIDRTRVRPRAICAAALLLALLALFGCKTRRQEREEFEREIAAYAPRVDVMRRALPALAALVPDSRIGTPELGPLDPPLEVPGRNSEVLALGDLAPLPEGTYRRPHDPWHDTSLAFACLETTSADNRHYSIPDVEAFRRLCDRMLALKYLVVVRDVYRRQPQASNSVSMETGTVTAEAFVLRIEPPALVGSLAFHAASSWSVDYRYNRERSGEPTGEAESAAQRDLQHRAAEALRAALGRSGATVETFTGMDPEIARPMQLPDVPAGWRRGARAPASYVVPGDWTSSAPERELLLADWRGRTSDGSIVGQFQLEWAKRDFESLDQFGETLAATLARTGARGVTRGTRRDAGGREWLTFERVDASAERQPIHIVTHAALSRDRASVYLAHCSWFEGRTDGGAAACPTILESLVAHH